MYFLSSFDYLTNVEYHFERTHQSALNQKTIEFKYNFDLHLFVYTHHQHVNYLIKSLSSGCEYGLKIITSFTTFKSTGLLSFNLFYVILPKVTISLINNLAHLHTIVLKDVQTLNELLETF